MSWPKDMSWWREQALNRAIERGEKLSEEEAAMAAGIRGFYGGAEAPLPDGVVPEEVTGEWTDEERRALGVELAARRAARDVNLKRRLASEERSLSEELRKVDAVGCTPHPWTACEYENDDGLACREQAVFGVQELGGRGEEAQACEAHVGFVLRTEEWRGSAWRVWTL